ncbi:hypothetical protein ABI59_03645 [Acidobacteria bacterium Mor1]|nr:hypothetical protein ABI59_03645 [Acidobacteria bacterium Mor1]
MDMSRYRALFLSEAREHLRAATEHAGQLESGGNAEALRSLFRHAHSLKGMAATMGYDAMAGLAHAAEDLLAALRGGETALTGELRELLRDSVACIGRIVESVEMERCPEDPGAEALTRRLKEHLAQPAAAPGAENLRPAVPLESPEPAAGTPAATTAFDIDLRLSNERDTGAGGVVSLLSRFGELGRLETVETPLTSLDAPDFDGSLKLQLISELERPGIEARLAAMPGVAGFEIREHPRAPDPVVESGERTWMRVRADLLDHQLEDAAELMLQHSRLSAALGELPPEAARHLDRVELLVRRLFGNVVEMRLVPFESVVEQLEHGTRDLATRLGKEVELEIPDTKVRLDRSLLERLVDPLLHILRNAVDHGIEAPDDREAAGKPRHGRIGIQVDRRGDQVRIRVRDDGRGIDGEQLRRRAVEQGLMAPDDAARLSQAESLLLVTLPGFSTAETTTEVSGRGVGMDAVRHRVESLGGRFDLRSILGEGSEMEMSLPLSMAAVPALMLRSGERLFAVPIASVERGIRLEGPRGRPVAPGAGEDGSALPLIDLAERLGLPASDQEEPGWALVLPTEAGSTGLIVDELLGRRGLIVRPLEAPLKGLREYSGAALLEDGRIALVLDPTELIPTGAEWAAGDAPQDSRP